jgi:hypothetical protein
MIHQHEVLIGPRAARAMAASALLAGTVSGQRKKDSTLRWAQPAERTSEEHAPAAVVGLGLLVRRA